MSTGSPDDLQAELARLPAENERLKAGGASGRERITVSPKGGVSVYGLGRFPITLYQEQWLRLLAMGDAIHQFIVEHKSELKLKDPSLWRVTSPPSRGSSAIALLFHARG